MRWQVAGAFGPAAPGCRWRGVSVTIRNRMTTRNVLIGVLSTLAASPTCVAQSFHSAARAARPTGSETLLVFPLENSRRLAWRVFCGVATASAGVAPCGRVALSQADFLSKFPPLRLDAFEYYIRGLLSPESEKDQQRLRDLREAARLEPGWDDPAFTLGQAYFARRDCASALPWLSRVPLAHERGPEAGFTAGVCHLLRNDAARAEAAFASLLVRGAINGRDTAGVAASGEGPARSGGEGCCALAEAFNNLGVARARLGKLREAVAAFERAAQLDPDEVDYWWNLGVIRMQANEPAPAVEAFREVLRRQTGDAEARALLIA